MKTLRTFFLLLFIVVISSGCKNNPSLELNNPSLELIIPVESSAPYFDAEFEWSTNSINSSRLIVSKDSLFGNLVLDTLLDVQSFRLKKKLIPDFKYYWKVEIGQTTVESFFIVEDIISQYEGTYIVDVLRRDWDLKDGVYNEENYQSTLQLIKDADKIKLIENSANIDESLPFIEDSEEDNLLYYGYPFFIVCQINMENDSIYVHRDQGGQGGGTKWLFKGKME